MTLLDQVNGMNDVSFTIGDIITIAGIVAGLVSVFVKMKIDRVKSDGKMETLEEKIADQKEDFLGAKNSRHAIRKEFAEADDKIHAEMKEDREKNSENFDKINNRLATIENGITRIETLLTK